MVQKSAPTEAQRRNGTILADFERRHDTSLRCSAIRRTGEPTTRAAAPNQALHVGIFGMAGRGGAAECQLDCCSARIAFSQSTISEIESFGATFGAVRAALPLARQFPLREPSEGPLYRRPAPPKALQGASERRELSVKARFARILAILKRHKFTLPPPRARGQTNHTSSRTEPRATRGYLWHGRAWRCGRMPAALLQRAPRVLSIDDERDRELPRHLGRPARRPAACAPISIARAVGRASLPPPRAARSATRRFGAARAIGEGAFAHRRQAPRAAQVYIAATANALANQAHEQLRRTKRYMWVSLAWPGVAVRPNASDNAEPSGASL
jgi:hypothetical protein